MNGLAVFLLFHVLQCEGSHGAIKRPCTHTHFAYCMTRIVINWRKLPPNVLENIQIQGSLTLKHSRHSKTTMLFEDYTPVVDAVRALTLSQKERAFSNPKIAGYIKLCEHIVVNGLCLGPLVGETVSRHLNGSKARDWINIKELPTELVKQLIC